MLSATIPRQTYLSVTTDNDNQMPGTPVTDPLTILKKRLSRIQRNRVIDAEPEQPDESARRELPPR